MLLIKYNSRKKKSFSVKTFSCIVGTANNTYLECIHLAKIIRLYRITTEIAELSRVISWTLYTTLMKKFYFLKSWLFLVNTINDFVPALVKTTYLPRCDIKS